MGKREKVREVEREGEDEEKEEGGGGWGEKGKEGWKETGGREGKSLLSSCGTTTVGSTTYAIPSVDKATFLSTAGDC